MIKDGVPASTILVITFTNRARDELRERLDELIGPVKAKAVTVDTFHSVCAWILRQANNSTVMVDGIQIQLIPCSDQYVWY
jgi:superfamily I DNA/RNA helicase